MTNSSNTQSNNWHLDKKVTIIILCAILSTLWSGLLVFADMHKDIELLKVQFLEQHQRDDAQDKAGADARSLLRAQLDRIESNQYRMIEQQVLSMRGRK